MSVWFTRVLRNWSALYRHRIWQAALDGDRSVHGQFYALLRIVSITLTGLGEIKLLSRAAALSYSSLLGIGPLIAIGVMVAGTVLHNADTGAIIEKLNQAIRFVAPQIEQLEQSAAAAGEDTRVVVNQKLVDLLNNFIEGSRSGTLGVAGALMLVVIVIQLFISIEESFNTIWGVHRGRPLFLRIVMYWTLVTLGAVLAVASLTLLSASTLSGLFANLPLGAELHAALRVSGPLIAFGTLVALLTCFYRFIPNTNVLWVPSVVGAVVVVVLLFANNYLAFFYLKSVLRSQSLFGSLSILPVLMAGLYIFWVIVLLGGQITYAVQNVHFRSSRTAWYDLNQHSRESLSLLVLVLIARRFKQCAPPFTASELSAAVRVPTQILNESLHRLMDLHLVTQVPPGPHESAVDYHYQPARPLGRITLREFRDSFALLGADPSGERLDSVDPVLRSYHERLSRAFDEALGRQSLDELLEQLPPPDPDRTAAT
ncbi:MAG TPA: YihY/virulence factor BrkB family protein [Opitutaceae bacterium]|nr:YihY/virulence factor BrkB family protein [Opitutaceae bacterium]